MCEIQEQLLSIITTSRSEQSNTELSQTLFGEYLHKSNTDTAYLSKFEAFAWCPVIGQGTRARVILKDETTTLKIPQSSSHIEYMELERLLTQQVYSSIQGDTFPEVKNIHIAVPQLFYRKGISCLQWTYVPGISLKMIFILDFVEKVCSIPPDQLIQLYKWPDQVVVNYLHHRGLKQEFINALSIRMHPLIADLLIENALIDPVCLESLAYQNPEIRRLGHQKHLIRTLSGEDMGHEMLLNFLAAADKIHTSLGMSSVCLGGSLTHDLRRVVAFLLQYEDLFPDLIRSNILVSDYKNQDESPSLTLIDMF